MLTFNTAGPILPDEHYHIPPLERFDLDGVLRLVDDKQYFVVHAPRQTGKTTALIALRDLLNERGYRCIHANLEAAQTAPDFEQAIRAVLSCLASRAELTLSDDFPAKTWPGVLAESGPAAALQETLTRWAAESPEPLVLLLDEADALPEDLLSALLQQLGADCETRAEGCPWSIAVCGVRDAREYPIPAGNPFTADRSIRLDDFSSNEVDALLGQHTEETGQRFTADAVDETRDATRGQPWLVNALAAGACFDAPAGRDRTRDITDEAIRDARERLIFRRPTHFRQIEDCLKDALLRRVIEPIVGGLPGLADANPDDVESARNLGLIASTDPVRIANPIYREVIPRILARRVEEAVAEDEERYDGADGNLDVPKLLSAFQQFFRENAEWWSQGFTYREAAAQVLLQAFLHRVVNAGGHITREYGLGMGRADLRITWRRAGAPQVFVIECKVKRARDGLDEVIRRGAAQTAAYMDRCRASEGHLVVFDTDDRKSRDERIFRREASVRRTAVETASGGTEETWAPADKADSKAADERLIQVWGV